MEQATSCRGLRNENKVLLGMFKNNYIYTHKHVFV